GKLGAQASLQPRSAAAIRTATQPPFIRARSSAGEHYLDMVGVTGSIPVVPTILRARSARRMSRRSPGSTFTRVSDALWGEGGLDACSLLGYAVRHFYDNGGVHARVLRIAGADGGAIAPTEAAFLQALTAAFAAGGPVDRIDRFNLICVPGLTDTTAVAMLQA